MKKFLLLVLALFALASVAEAGYTKSYATNAANGPYYWRYVLAVDEAAILAGTYTETVYIGYNGGNGQSIAVTINRSTMFWAALQGSYNNSTWTGILVRGAASFVADPPEITSSLTASATQGQAFSYTITASNTPTSYGATGLPTGLSRSGAVISGTPTGALGTSNVSISATNAGGTGSATLALTVGTTQYHADFTVTNTTAATAIFTVRHWYLTDPSDVSRQHSTQLELQPGESTQVHLKEAYPFVYDVQRQDEGAQIDGSVEIPEPVEVIEDTDSSMTDIVTDPVTEHSVEAVGPGAPDPEPTTTLPNPTPTTIAQADANDTARATDARNDALMGANAATGTTAAVNAMNKALGAKLGDVSGGAGVSEDVSDRTEAADAAMGEGGTGAQIWGHLQGIGSEIATMVDAWQLSVTTTGWPSLGWDWPAQLGGGGFYFDLDEYSSWITIMRTAILGLCAWEFVVMCIAAIKSIAS